MGGQGGLKLWPRGIRKGSRVRQGALGVLLNLFSSTISGSHTMSEGRRRTVMFPKSLASHCSRLSIQACKVKRTSEVGAASVQPPQWSSLL